MNAIPITLLSAALAAATLAIFTRGARRSVAGLVALIAAALSIVSIENASAGKPPAPGMAGRWEANGKIIVTWCKQKDLPLSLNIADDGTVTGKIGDAELVEGKLKRNRGSIGKRLKIKTDFIITGKLKGDIVKSEGIGRTGVDIPLNFDGKKFSGGLHTTGRKFGGKTAMKLSAGDIVLKRLPK